MLCRCAMMSIFRWIPAHDKYSLFLLLKIIMVFRKYVPKLIYGGSLQKFFLHCFTVKTKRLTAIMWNISFPNICLTFQIKISNGPMKTNLSGNGWGKKHERYSVQGAFQWFTFSVMPASWHTTLSVCECPSSRCLLWLVIPRPCNCHWRRW